MNVYDFDGTIYSGDSTVDFFLYALRRRPALVRYLSVQAAGTVAYLLKRKDKTGLKEAFFSFLAGIDAEELVERFWDVHEDRIYEWYLAQQEPEDVVISASPEFLLEPICRRLGIRHLIASRVDPNTGKFTGANCRGAEKVTRFHSKFPEGNVGGFYSDSESDRPMAELADRAFLVRGGRVGSWNLNGQE